MQQSAVIPALTVYLQAVNNGNLAALAFIINLFTAFIPFSALDSHAHFYSALLKINIFSLDKLYYSKKKSKHALTSCMVFSR